MANERRVIQIEIDGSTSEISAKKLEQSLARIERQIDPLGVATKNYNRDLSYLKAGLDSGGLSADQHAAKVAALGRQYSATQARIGDLNKQTVETAQVTKTAGDSAGQTGMSFGGMAGRATAAVAAVLALAVSVKSVAEGIATAGDESRMMTARLNVLTGAALGSRAAFEQVYALSQRTGVALADTASSFGILAIAAGDFGASTKDIERATEAIIKLGRVGGSSADQVKTVLQQLGQGIASGTFQGDELRSVRENAPLVARAIAKEFGVTVGELKKLGEEGKLQGERVFRALVSAADGADEAFRKLPPTMEQAGNRAGNAWKALSAALDDSLGLSARLSAGMDATAAGVETLARRIAGDLNQAIRDTNAEIAKLQGARDRAARDQRALDERGPGSPQTEKFTGDRGGPRQAQVAADRELQRTLDRAANLADERRFRDEFEAIGTTDQRIAARATAVAKAKADAEQQLRGLRDKADPISKATREYNDEVAKLNDRLKSGAMSQAQYNVGLADAKKILAGVGSGAKQTAEAVKALADATREADFAKVMADGAEKGAGFLAEMEARAKAADKAIEALGKRDAVFEGKFVQQLLSKRADDFRKDFTLDTAQIERDNKIIEAQLRLIGERPEIVDREIALLRIRNDLEAKGQTVSEEALAQRAAALSMQEKLNRQLEDGKRSAELWAEPFKNAIQGVQSTFTDFFEQIISGGIRSFSDLGQQVKKIWFRMMAEIAAAAVIRPVIQFAIGGLGQLGLIGPQTMQALGVSPVGMSGGGSSAGGSVGGAGGGFNPFGMFGSGGFSGMLGGVGRWLNSPITGQIGTPAFGELAALEGGTVASAPGGGFLGTTTWGQGLGALAGVGMGIYNLTQGNTIGGIGGILGAGVSLIPGIGQIAGPIIGIASSILGSLFKQKTFPEAQGWHTYNASSGRYGGRATFERGGMSAPIMPGIGNDALKLIGAFGGSVAEGQSAPEYYIWRGYEAGKIDATVTAEGSPTYRRLLEKAWASGQVKTTEEAQWAARTELWTDDAVGGEWAPLPVNAPSADSEKVMQQLALLILKAGVRDGAFAGLSETSQKIIRNYPDADTQGLADALTWGKGTYDQLVRTDTITNAEKALTSLKDSFEAAIARAKEYRLATDGLVAAQERATKKYGEDFKQGIDDQLLGLRDPAALQTLQLEREREAMIREAQYVTAHTGVLIDINKIEELYGEKRKAIVAQQMASLVDFERRLRFGDLSAANPLDTLAGAMGAYQANAAQALAGNTSAISQYQGLAEAALNQARSYYGNNYATEDLRNRILSEIALLQGKPAGTPAAANDELLAAVQEQNRLLRELLDRQQAA